MLTSSLNNSVRTVIGSFESQATVKLRSDIKSSPPNTMVATSRDGRGDRFMNSEAETGDRRQIGSQEAMSIAVRARSPSPVKKRFGNGMDTKSAAGVRELHGYVGFANIPNQVYRKAIKQGFDFTLMVVGQSGLGKSTFINSLFLADVYPDQSLVGKRLPETVRVEEQTVKLVENGANLSLTLIDTPGFGDQVDNSKCWNPIIQYVDKKYAEYFSEETKVQRSENIPDHRVHCCLYFIAPTGHGLKPLDVEFMRNLSDRVNIIPVIAKADTMTPDELVTFKKRVLDELTEQKIKIYQFPDLDEGEDDKEMTLMRVAMAISNWHTNFQLISYIPPEVTENRVPFAVIGSNMIQDAGNGKKVRCRKYPWGIVEVENLEHNDFMALRNMIIRAHMIDLVDVTRSVHYENFRCRQLMLTNGKSSTKMSGDQDPFTMIETEKREHEEKMKQNHADMERVFKEKVREKQQKYKVNEQETENKLNQLRAALEAKQKEIEQKQRQLADFKEQYPQLASYASTISVGSLGSNERSPPDGKGSSKKKKNTLNVFGRHKENNVPPTPES